MILVRSCLKGSLEIYVHVRLVSEDLYKILDSLMERFECNCYSVLTPCPCIFSQAYTLYQTGFFEKKDSVVLPANIIKLSIIMAVQV